VGLRDIDIDFVLDSDRYRRAAAATNVKESWYDR